MYWIEIVVRTIEITIAFGRLVGWQVPKSCNPCNPYWLLYCNEVTAPGSQIDTFQTTRTVLFVATNPTFVLKIKLTWLGEALCSMCKHGTQLNLGWHNSLTTFSIHLLWAFVFSFSLKFWTFFQPNYHMHWKCILLGLAPIPALCYCFSTSIN